MLDSVQYKGRFSVSGKIEKTISVKFQLYYLDSKESTLYVKIRNKTLNEEEFMIKEMQKESQSCYSVQLDLKENCKYKYQYEAFNNITQKKDIELKFRDFEYAEKDKFQIDQWNKVWCLYRILPKSEDIFQAYHISIKNNQDGNYFELKKSKYIFPAKDHYELLDDSEIQKFRQFSLKSKEDETEELSNQIEIQNISKYKMNCIYVEFDMQLFSKDKSEKIKQFLKSYETNQEWKKYNQIKNLQQQIEELNQKLLEQEKKNSGLNTQLVNELKNSDNLKKQIQTINLNHQKELNSLNVKFEQEKTTALILQDQLIQNMTRNFQEKIEQLSEKIKIQNNQYLSMQDDFDQFQKSASKTTTEYIYKLEESQKMLQLKELQLLQIKNNHLNKNENSQNEEIIIDLCIQNGTQDQINQLNILKDKLQQYEKNFGQMSLKNEEIESELLKKGKIEHGLKRKIQEQIENQNSCIKNLQIAEKQVQELKEQTLNDAKNNQKLKQLLEKIKKKCQDLEVYKIQYQNLFQKYEEQRDQYLQLEIEKNKNEMEFQQFKEQKQLQLQSMVSENEKSLKQMQDETQILLEQQKAELYKQQKYQHELFMKSSLDILDSLQNEILYPYFNHQLQFSQNLSCNLNSEIQSISSLMLNNFESIINIAADGINIITNSSFNHLKIDLIDIHQQIIDEIQEQKNSSEQSPMTQLLQLINQFQNKLQEIQQFSLQVDDMIDQDQDQIRLINTNCQTLDKLLDIVIKQRSILKRKNDELEIFCKNQDIIIVAFKQFQAKTLSGFQNQFIRSDLEPSI
ncbi:unnamed protein product [Paramecium sonneborni]|uniref:Uncharacterized protein n=1 Tax=Paramecium sonneborni TaxID=65129 RepID=A0A8S1PZ89_9CILI|nr:unnamed protein product [Paramecium sonneborni]